MADQEKAENAEGEGEGENGEEGEKEGTSTRGCCPRKHLRVADFNAVIIFSAFVSEM